jgi:CheY-like chemotaxis protein
MVMPHDEVTRLRGQIELLQDVDRDKGRLLDLYAHELRNPIAAISMAVEALQRLEIAGDQVKTLTQIISRQSRFASQLIDDLLEYSRVVSGKAELVPQPFDLGQLVTQVLMNRQRQFEEQGIVLQKPALRSAWVEADASKISSALTRVLTCLARRGKPGEHILAAIEATTDTAQICIELRAAASAADTESAGELCAELSGEVPTANTADRWSIELALAAVLVQLNQGLLTVQQANGNETAISISLPIARGAPQATRADHPSAASPSVALSILIIDDSPDVVTSLQFLLKSAGHAVAVATTAADGIRMAREIRPDVVLCDITLPDRDGFAVARELRASGELRSNGTYLIAVSGFDDAEHLRRSREAGFDLHLSKPDGFVGLSERLQNLPIARRSPSE